MPLDVLTTADNVRVQGSMTIINDPNGNSGNLNVVGTITGSGAMVAASNLTVSGSLSALSGAVVSGGTLTASGSLSALSGLSVSGTLTASNQANLIGGASITGGLQFDQIVGGPAAATTTSQLISGTSSTITMTGSGRVIYLNASTTQSTAVLTPTSSAAATATSYTNGTEVLLVNIASAPSSTITIPSGSAGAAAVSAVTISGGQTAKMIYVSALQSWLLI